MHFSGDNPPLLSKEYKGKVPTGESEKSKRIALIWALRVFDGRGIGSGALASGM
jgi:hypothetical protein